VAIVKVRLLYEILHFSLTDATDQTELKELIDIVLKVSDLDVKDISPKLGELRRRTGGQLLASISVELNEAKTEEYTIYVRQIKRSIATFNYVSHSLQLVIDFSVNRLISQV
jgi:hypothetical protein